MKKHNCIVPSEVGWVEVELDNSEIDSVSYTHLTLPTNREV